MVKFFNAPHNKFYITNDNWKNYSIDNSIPENAKLEDNQDKTTEIKIREYYSSNRGKALVIIDELKNINKSCYSKKNLKDGYGLAFEVFSISVLHNLGIKQVFDKNIVIGGNDGKVDAMFFDEKAKEAYIYQIKLGFIPEDSLAKCRNNINDYKNNNLISSSNCSDLLAFCRENDYQLKHYRPIFCDISINGSGQNHIDSYSIFDIWFENKLISQDFKENKMRLEFNIESRVNPSFASHEERNFSNFNDNEYFMFIRANKFKEVISKSLNTKKDIEKLFGYNVRGFCGKNKPMIETISGPDAKNFCLYNNGISIVGKSEVLDNKIVVSEPFIVNGQQTFFNINDYKGVISDDVYLPVFIKNYDSPDVLMNIAKYNNKQKSIKPIDLLSIDANVRIIQRSLYENSKYYLNICSSGSKEYLRIANKIYGKKEIIELQDFLRTYDIIQNKKDLGKWKNSVSDKLSSCYLENNNRVVFDLNISQKACDIIINRNEIIDENKSDYSIASVAIEYLLFKTNNNCFKVKKIVDKYLKEFYDDIVPNKRPRNKADLFKNDKYKTEIDRILNETN